MNEPLWMKYAQREVGVCEIPGHNHEPRILEYFASTVLHVRDDETPWCAAFVGWALMRGGVLGTRLALARSYLTWGRTIYAPSYGCIVVLRRGAPPSGHVGFYVRSASHGRFEMLGGNQSDSVCVREFAVADVLGYRWPMEARAEK